MTTVPKREDADLMRRRLLNAGVEPWLVSSTPDYALRGLMRWAIPHLTLVPDADDTVAQVLRPVFGEVDAHAIGMDVANRAIRDLGLPGGGAA